MHFPLPLSPVGITADPASFSRIDVSTQVEIPVNPHPGSYGQRRRHDVHVGVDLYCPDGTPVLAMEPGKVVAILPFTGPSCGYPWWEDTLAVYVMGENNIIVYGEVSNCAVSVGDAVAPGEMMASVKRVLRVDKGRPMSMLHLEVHERDMIEGPEEVALDEPIPRGFVDPTPLLVQAARTLPSFQE